MLPWKLWKRQILPVNQIFHQYIFTWQVWACELQHFSCHDLANYIYLQTAKTLFSHLKRSVPSITLPCLLKITASRQINMSHKHYVKPCVNNKNELWKTVRLQVSVKKPQLQSVLIFFKFVLSRLLLYFAVLFILSLNGFFLFVVQLVFTVGLQHPIRDTLNSVIKFS